MLVDTSPQVWDTLDLRKLVVWGSLFTVGVDLAIYPMELLKTKVQVETKASATERRRNELMAVAARIVQSLT
jgi:hypothetical protein